MAYYRALYAEMDRGEQDYPLPDLGTSLLDLLSVNQVFRRRCLTDGAYVLGQAFARQGNVSTCLRTIPRDVLVPFGEGAGLTLIWVPGRRNTIWPIVGNC